MERQKTFDFRGEKITVKFPNVGQMIDMESLKQSLTGNKYGAMSASGVKSMFFALDMVDTLSFFEIMCPKIKRMLDVKSFTQMPPEDIKDVVSIYKEHIAPWYNKLLKDLYDLGDAESSQESNVSQ